MKLTVVKLKQLILEVLEGESGVASLIKSGEWENINQALSLTVDVGLPLEELPWELLPMSIMKDDDLVELGRYLLELKGFEGDGSGGEVGMMLRHGIKGMVGKFPGIGKRYVELAIRKILGLSVMREAIDDTGLSEATNSKKAVLKLAVGDVILDIPAGFYNRKDAPDRMNPGHHQIVIVTSNRMKMMDITYEYNVEDVQMNIFVRDPDEKILDYAGGEYLPAGSTPDVIRKKFDELMDTLKKEK